MTNNTIPNVPRELKPCPFCGDIPSENARALTDGGFKYGAIQCGCGALGPDVLTEYKDWPHWRDAASAAWNERALLSAPSPAGVDGCKGKNCGVTDGVSHSDECFAEHERAYSCAGVDGLEVEAYLHTMHMEIGQTRQFCSKWKGDPFGIAGEDYSSTYAVTSDPLCRLSDAKAIIDGLRGEVADLRSMLATVSKAGLRVRTERDQHAQRIGELEGLLRSCLPALSDGGCAALANRIDAALAADKEASK